MQKPRFDGPCEVCVPVITSCLIEYIIFCYGIEKACGSLLLHDSSESDWST